MKSCSIVVVLAVIIVGFECCSDSASACSSWVANGFCTNSFYTSAQRALYCAKSCGLCSDSTTSSSSTCTDSSSNCAGWNANGFCSSTHYTSAVKKQYCASTCSLCSSSSDSSDATTAATETTTP